MTILKELNGKKFEDLPEELQDKFLSRGISVIKILAQSQKDIKFEIFVRLNRGSVKLSEQELRVFAEQIYKKESKKVMTGTLDVDFANPFIDLYDVVTFIADDNQVDLGYLDGIWFSINSISESYSSSGYTQVLNIDSDPDLENTLQERKAPPILKLGLTPIVISDSASILSRKL